MELTNLVPSPDPETLLGVCSSQNGPEMCTPVSPPAALPLINGDSGGGSRWLRSLPPAQTTRGITRQAHACWHKFHLFRTWPEEAASGM